MSAPDKVLAHIEKYGMACQMVLSSSVGMSSNTFSSAISSLRKKHYVSSMDYVVSASKHKQPVKLYFITPPSESTVTAYYKKVESSVGKPTHGLTGADFFSRSIVGK